MADRGPVKSCTKRTKKLKKKKKKKRQNVADETKDGVVTDDEYLFHQPGQCDDVNLVDGRRSTNRNKKNIAGTNQNRGAATSIRLKRYLNTTKDGQKWRRERTNNPTGHFHNENSRRPS